MFPVALPLHPSSTQRTLSMNALEITQGWGWESTGKGGLRSGRGLGLQSRVWVSLQGVPETTHWDMEVGFGDPCIPHTN